MTRYDLYFLQMNITHKTNFRSSRRVSHCNGEIIVFTLFLVLLRLYVI